MYELLDLLDDLAYGAFNFLAVVGWVFLFVLVVSMITGTFDDLLMIVWEVTE